MKKLLLGTIFLALALVLSVPAIAEVNVSIRIPLPPGIVFEAPPAVIVLPDTNNVYVVPESEVDIYFWNGWWWRPWEGRWYRSQYYNRGWSYYRNVPGFYYDVDPGWRGHYRERNWYGHRWEYERIPERQLKRNWKSWNNNKHWERQKRWGVQDYQPRPQPQRRELRQQRQEQYQQRPEVQRHREQLQERQRRSQVQQHKQPAVQQPHGQKQSQPNIKKPKGQDRQQDESQNRQFQEKSHKRE